MNLPPFNRFQFIRIIAILMVVSILIQMVRIQTSASAQELPGLSSQYEYRTIYPERGNIYDRWGNLLAGNKEVYEIGVSLNEMQNQETVLTTIAGLTGADYMKMQTRIEEAKAGGVIRYVVLTDFVTPDVVAQIEKKMKEYQNLPAPRKGQVNPSLEGVYWQGHLIRSYPENELAANVLGYYPYRNRDEATGVYGVEQYYNSLLAGVPQQIQIARDPNRVENIPSVPPGSSLVLTIDREIQSAMETLIDQAVEANGAESGTILVMDPRSGEFLALATQPRMNLNNYWEILDVYPGATPFNRIVSQTFEPGSTFKVLTMAAALDSNTVEPETEFFDNGYIEVGGYYIYNWDRGAWGWQTMTGCMQHSLNVCLSWVATETGADVFYNYMNRFGIGHRTNIDLAGEALFPLSVPGDQYWADVNLATNSFGQGVAVTPVQLITAVSAIANDGKIMAPHILKSYIQDGIQHNIDPMVISQPVTTETAHTLTEMLAISLEEEASNALVEGYRVAGKTGTGEIPNETGYSDMTNASFIGWGPVDDPKFVVYVWLEKPTSNPYGSVVAAPVFKEAVEKIVMLMDIPPDAVRNALK